MSDTFGIKPALAVRIHERAAVGFCSIQTITFEHDAPPRITSVELTYEEAQRLYDVLGSAMPKMGPGGRP